MAGVILTTVFGQIAFFALCPSTQQCCLWFLTASQIYLCVSVLVTYHIFSYFLL